MISQVGLEVGKMVELDCDWINLKHSIAGGVLDLELDDTIIIVICTFQCID